jgi:preprotein translocase subunit SecE
MGRIEQFKQYLLDVRAELKKVVWPSRRDTTTTTLIVLVMVIVASLFLWLVDSLLALAVRFFIG